MDNTGLKAREIEALTFLYTPDVPSAAAGGGPRRATRFRVRPATVGLTAAFVVITALAWVMFSSR